MCSVCFGATAVLCRNGRSRIGLMPFLNSAGKWWILLQGRIHQPPWTIWLLGPCYSSLQGSDSLTWGEHSRAGVRRIFWSKKATNFWRKNGGWSLQPGRPPRTCNNTEPCPAQSNQLGCSPSHLHRPKLVCAPPPGSVRETFLAYLSCFVLGSKQRRTWLKSCMCIRSILMILN